MGGIWAQVSLRHEYDDTATGKRSPFRIDELKPIQVATFDLAEYQSGRREFTADEWIDFLIRSVGLEPSYFERRLKLLFLTRLLRRSRGPPEDAEGSGHDAEDLL